jgi:hypothetical protein
MAGSGRYGDQGQIGHTLTPLGHRADVKTYGLGKSEKSINKKINGLQPNAQ